VAVAHREEEREVGVAQAEPHLIPKASETIRTFVNMNMQKM
jgi:hypothetical protein